MRLRYVAVAAAIVVAVLGGAWYLRNRPHVDHGRVIAKEHDPARDWVYMQPIYSQSCSSTGKSVSCVQILAGEVPVPEHDPEQWRLRLDDGEHTGWVEVPQQVFDRVAVGDHYDARGAR